MRVKKGISILLVAALLLSICGIEGMPSRDTRAAAAESSAAGEADRYYYRQLTPEGKAFYDAMYAMYTEGIMKTGTEDYDLLSNGYVSRQQLVAYANGDMQLLSDMGAARDAFYADYPDIFYVDFSYLSIRVTRDSTDTYHAYLGPGRGDTYFVQGFTSRQQVEEAIDEYEARINEIVDGARKLSVEEGDRLTLPEKQIKYVHDEIIRNTTYRLEDNCKKENVGHIRTVYGALVKRESVCEGYARTVKAVLDRLGIPCVLVQGIYRYSENDGELHMWNYVKPQADGEWYGVDATMDDPISRNGENGLDGYENSEYLLVGEDIMSRRHVPNGIMSEADYEFSYPQLGAAGAMFERIYNKSGLTVMYNKDGTHEDLDAGIFKISYNGMGYARAAETGKYMLGRFHIYYEETGEWDYGSWGYLLPDIYEIFEDTDTEITIPVPHCLYVEFAITDIAPGDYLQDPNKTAFQGDPMLLEAETGMIYNPSGDYVAPPYIKSLTPGASGRIYTGQQYHVTAVYDDELQLAQGAEKAGYELILSDPHATAREYSVIENFHWDGKSTIEFDFMPSKMWADDSIEYLFQITGLVGKRSLKTPNPISYFASGYCASCAYRSSGYYWNLFGKPALLENTDLSVKDWETKEGDAVSPDMVNRLALVVTSPTNKQTDDMNDLISDSLSGEQQLLKSETYNINLTVCKKQVVKTGQSVRVSLGFPAGYGPNDAGVTFKAYHFTKNDAGEIIDVQEIPCIITQYGLLILCDSFSPFALAVVEGDAAPQDNGRTVILSKTTGGTIEGGSSVITMYPGDSSVFTVQADEGYELDELVVAGKIAQITDSNSMTVTLDYESLSDGINIVDAVFAAKAVHERDQERGETLVQPAALPAEITLESENITVKEQESFSITPVIKEQNGIHTYQWYKDGNLLAGQRGPSLTVAKAAKKDAGDYTLTVTTTAGTVSTKAASKLCKVTIVDGNSGDTGSQATDTPPGDSNPQATDTPPGDTSLQTSAAPGEESHQIAAVTGLKAVSHTAGRVKLTWKRNLNADGYYVLRNDGKKGRFARIANVKKPAYTDKACLAGSAYRYKVRAYKTAGETTILGKKSKEAKILVKPQTPKKVSGKQTGSATAELSFKKVSGAVLYRIYCYNAEEEAYLPAYKIKGKKLYWYQEESEKWVYHNKIDRDNGKDLVICRLAGLARGTTQKFYIRATVSKTGYKTVHSKNSKVVRIRMR